MANEYMTCYDQAALVYECGFESTLYANLSRAAMTFFCEMPRKAELPAMVACANKRYIQTFVFGEFKEHIGRLFAYGDMDLKAEEKREKLCRSQGYIISDTMDNIGRKCGSNEFTFLCHILSDSSAMLALGIIVHLEICPAEIYSRCRYSNYYLISDYDRF